jgi:Ser/Thr protein kinase RdoA (MazF antagonist)
MSSATDPNLIHALAAAALEHYELAPGTALQLCNVSENHTYRLSDAAGAARYALRVHRPGYRSAQEIESELVWLDALDSDGVVPTPGIVAARDGRRVVSARADGIEPRYVVVFDWVPGIAPDLDSGEAALGQFATLGAVSARMHRHARSWPRPGAFTRPRWDYEHTIGPHGHWGPWQDGLGLGAPERRQLQRLDAAIAARLAVFGQDESRFGLVHADLRLANVLIDGSTVRVIDFDDCGLSWFMYDFATAVSFMEDHPRVPELREAWLRGYRSQAELEPAAEAELDTFVMLRRLLLVAWIGSHHTFAPEAAELGAGFTAGTCTLAETYLGNHSS